MSMMFRESLGSVILNLRAAENLILKASRRTADHGRLMKLALEYRAIDSFLSQVIQVQLAANDALFDKGGDVFKESDRPLRQEEAHLKEIIADVEVVAKILGFIAETVAVVAKL